MAWSLPAVLAVCTGLLFSCTVLGKYSAHQRRLPLKPKDTTVCMATPGLSKAQIKLCRRLPESTAVALKGLDMAVKECQHQLQHHRWNCSSLSTRTKNLYANAIFQKGFKETAFAYAISSAGVVLAVAEACSHQGSLMKCHCDTQKKKGKWTHDSKFKWDGCSSHNLRYGIKFSKMFLESQENGDDIHSQINLHNNHVGRTAVSANMQVKCKCHGISASCELKTCFRVVPKISVIGKILKEKLESAILVDQSNIANRDLQLSKSNQKKQKQRVKLKQWTPHTQKHKRGLRNDLLYYENSPNFCEDDPFLDIPGTKGRTCNRTHQEHGSCSILCCGRGYNLIKQKRDFSCNCRFYYCCKVECQTCTVEEWISTCK